MLLVLKEANNSSRQLNIGDSSKSRNNTSVKLSYAHSLMSYEDLRATIAEKNYFGQ